MFRIAPFRPTADGMIKASLDRGEIELLVALPKLLRPLIEEDIDDEAAQRLFPAASRDDPEVAAGFRAMVRSSLASERLEKIAEFERELGEASRRGRGGRWTGKISTEEAEIWLSVMNDARLVLGTRLGVTEDGYIETEDEIAGDLGDTPGAKSYRSLTVLVEFLVQSLSIGAGYGATYISPSDINPTT